MFSLSVTYFLVANAGTTGEKRKIELLQVEAGVSTPTQDDEQGPPLPKKKKTMSSVEPSQSSASTATMERNKHSAPLNTKKMNNGSKKRPGDETFINANPVTPARPAKKAKIPIRRSGKIILLLKDRHLLTETL